MAREKWGAWRQQWGEPMTFRPPPASRALPGLSSLSVCPRQPCGTAPSCTRAEAVWPHLRAWRWVGQKEATPGIVPGGRFTAILLPFSSILSRSLSSVLRWPPELLCRRAWSRSLRDKLTLLASLSFQTCPCVLLMQVSAEFDSCSTK